MLVTTLGGFLNSLVFALFMLVFDWRMGAVTLLGIVVFLRVTSAMEKKSREGVPARQEAQAILVEAVLETIQGDVYKRQTLFINSFTSFVSS